jgi:hypothetical protein
MVQDDEKGWIDPYPHKYFTNLFYSCNIFFLYFLPPTFMMKKETPDFETIGRLAPERDQIADALSLFSDTGFRHETQPEARPKKGVNSQASLETLKGQRPRKKSSGGYLDSPPNDSNSKKTNGHQDDESDEGLAEAEMSPDRTEDLRANLGENILSHKPLFN